MVKRHSVLGIAACAILVNFFAEPTHALAQTADATSGAVGPNADATNYSVSGGYSANSTFDSIAIGAYATATGGSGGNEAIGMLSTAMLGVCPCMKLH